MTLRSRDLTQMPADTAALGQQLLPEPHPFWVLGDHLADIIQDAELAAL